MLVGNGYTYLSPGVYLDEIDLTIRAQIASSITCAMVFESTRGTLKRFFTSNGTLHEKMYGKADPKISFAHDAARMIHKESPQLWNQRVVNGALHAGTTIYKDAHSKNAGTNGRLLAMPFAVGQAAGYEGGRQDFWLLSFSGDLQTSNAFAMTVTNGMTSQSASAVFASSHNSTMSAIASAIQTAMNSFGSGGYVTVVTEPGALASANKYMIAISTPTDASITFGTPAVTLGSARPTVAIDGEAAGIHVFGENPGSWGSNVGHKITNVNVGQRQRFRITFGSALITGNQVSVGLNGNSPITATYATSNDATLAALATALAADASIDTATVVSVPGAVDNDRSIEIIAAEAAPGYLRIDSVAVTGGASQPAVVYFETLKGIVPDGTFSFEVYDKTVSIVKPIETWRATLQLGADGNGFEQGLDAILNRTPGTGSFNVRVIVTDAGREWQLDKMTTVYRGVPVIDKTINFMAGGDDGAKVLSSHVNTGWDSFKNREIVPVRLLVNAGYIDVAVQQYMTAMAEYRHDCIAVLDAPSDRQDTNSLFDFRMTELNIDSSFAAMYSPDVLISDPYTGRRRFVPPSGRVTQQIAYSDKVGTFQKAPAGYKRGVMKDVLGLRFYYDIGDRELLDPIGINCIVYKNKVGATILGQNTLQVVQSILSGIHARRILNAIEAAYSDALDFESLFETNTAEARSNARSVGVTVCEPFRKSGALEDYDIICDITNNGPEERVRDVMNVHALLTIAHVNKQVLLHAVLTKSGASFSETIVSLLNAGGAMATA